MITLVVKVTGDPRGGLHGTVSRVAGGETRTFAGSVQLVAAIEEWTASEGLWPQGKCATTGAPAAVRVRGQAGADSSTHGQHNV